MMTTTYPRNGLGLANLGTGESIVMETEVSPSAQDSKDLGLPVPPR